MKQSKWFLAYTWLMIFVLLLSGIFFLKHTHFPVVEISRPAFHKNSLYPTDEVKQFPVDINSADANQLEYLPGIGPHLAQEILIYRSEHGGFHSYDDLLNIKGIGKTTLSQLIPYVTLGGTDNENSGNR